MHDPVVIFDPIGEIVLEVNERACETYGLPRNEFIGMSLRTISRRVSMGAAHITATLNARRFHTFETVQRRRDGSELVLEVHALPIEWMGRQAILSINRDITEHSRMLHRLEDAAAEWQLTVDALHAVLVLVDARGYITRANLKAADEAATIGVPHLIGRRLTELADHAPWGRAAELVAGALRTRIPATMQVTDKVGQKTWEIAVTLTACPTGDNQAVLIIRDMSRALELEAMLRRTESMAEVGRLVAGVAHEVRNPLFIISASIEALQTRVPDVDETSQQLRANLLHEVRRLTALMNDLLEYGKPAELKATIATVDHVLIEAASHVIMHAAEKNVRIVNKFPAGTHEVLMDPLRLSQAFHNLLHNAIHFSPPAGTVTIGGGEVERAGMTWIVCTIDDCGPGFPPEELGSVFEPFFSRRPGGTGLGLSIARRTVELHGGHITASNRAEDGGARVTVELPRYW